jgi:trimeric autotransporter adhesin
MADNPLVQFASDTLTQAQADQTAAQKAVTTAQTDLKTKTDAWSAAKLNLKSTQQKVTNIRAQMAAASTADDGAALVVQLRQAILDEHAAQAAALTAGAAVADAGSVLAKAVSRSGAAVTRAANGVTELANAKQQAGPRDALKDAAGRAPLATLRADATAALAADPAVKAETRIEAEFPAKLLERARAGAASEKARLDRARGAATDAEDAAATVGAPGAPENLALSRAVAALSDYVQAAKATLDQTLSVLANVADPNTAKLTPDEVKSIQSKKPDGSDDATLAAARNDAADASTKVVEKQQDVDDKQAAVDKARLKARAKGLDDAVVDADSAVVTAEAALKAAQAALITAQGVLTSDKVQTLAAWAATVPDANWQLLADHESARAALTGLTTLDPVALVKAVADAETVLVATLKTGDKAPALLELIREEGAARAALLQSAASASQARALSAMRCDF